MKSFNASADRPTQIYSYLHRRHLMKLICWSSLGAGFWMVACDPKPAGLNLKTKKERKMESESSTSTIQMKIPAIDTLVPTEIQTATFALG